MNKRNPKPVVEQREFDKAWQVLTPASCVRIGHTDKELVKEHKAVDLPRWVSVFVSKNKKECDKWLDTNREYVVKLMTLYEVA